MKKKFLVVFAICMGMFSTNVFAMEKTDIDLFYLGRDTKLDNPIYTENGAYFIPLRECAEQIGYTVEYTPSVITLTDTDDMTIEYHLDDNTTYKYGYKYDEKCHIKNIDGLCYVDAMNFYRMTANTVTKTENNGKKALHISSSSKPYHKNNFNDSISYLDVIQNNQNGVISPISMKLSLAMVANGTTGQTQQEILKTLGYDSLEQLNQFVSDTLNWTVEERRSDYRDLNHNEGNIHFANSLWYNSGTQNTDKTVFNENFKNCIQSVFKGTADTVTQDKAVGIINKWVEQQTNGMIKNIISNADFETALINTTYFKCCWAEEFQNENTKKDIFYNIDGTQSQTEFMNSTPEYQNPYYCETNGWQMLGLPYCDKNYTMYLFLPEKGKPLTLDNDTINTLFHFQEKVKVQITMPKFTTEQSYDFKDTLKAMGIHAMFQNVNDFSNMYTQENRMYLSDVLQKTKIIVNEQGTEAASGTIMATRGIDMTKPAIFKADRPFIYMITKTTGNSTVGTSEEVLFIGQYVTAKQ